MCWAGPLARQDAAPTDGRQGWQAAGNSRKGGGPADDPRRPHHSIPLLPSGRIAAFANHRFARQCAPGTWMCWAGPLARQDAAPTDGRQGWKAAGNSRKGGGPADDPRRPHHSIPLLPSGPGGIFKLASRGANGATIETRERSRAGHCSGLVGLGKCAPISVGRTAWLQRPVVRFSIKRRISPLSFTRSGSLTYIMWPAS